MKTVSLDDSPENADWIKQTWDLPPYGSPDFLAALGGVEQLESFKQGRVYKLAVEQGLIHDDEWVADYVETVPNQEDDPEFQDTEQPDEED